MNKIIEQIFTTTERSKFTEAIKDTLVKIIEDEIEDIRKTDWLFTPDVINNALDEMVTEVIAEIKEEAKNKLMPIMMEKMSKAMNIG